MQSSPLQRYVTKTVKCRKTGEYSTKSLNVTRFENKKSYHRSALLTKLTILGTDNPVL